MASLTVKRKEEYYAVKLKHTNDDAFDDFPKISDHFPKIFHICSKGKTNVSEHSSNVFQRLPRIDRCFDHTATYISTF